MIGISKRQKIVTGLFGLVGMIILSACHSYSVLTINKDDTYSLDIDFSQSTTLSKGKKCLDIIPLTKEQAAAIDIKDKTTDKEVKCRITLKNQHISKAQKPFVTIKHYADSFQVQLAPLKKLDYLKSNQTDFKLTIVFPGPVLSINSGLNPKISDNQVTWENPEVLAQGFTAVGQDHQGMTQSNKWLIFLTVLLILMALLIYLTREHELVKPRLQWVKNKATQLKETAVVKLAGPLSALDFASKPNRRARRAKRFISGNGERPKINLLWKNLGSWKKRWDTDPWTESEETTAELQESVKSAAKEAEMSTSEIKTEEVAKEV